MERGIASERDRRPARCGWALSIGVHASIVGAFVFAAAPPQTRVPEPALRVEILSAVPSRTERAHRRAAPRPDARPDATPAPWRGDGAAPVKAASRAVERTVAPAPKRKPPAPVLAATPARLLLRQPAPEPLPPPRPSPSLSPSPSSVGRASAPPSPVSVAAPASVPVGVAAGNPAPRYPIEARRRGIEGRVVVRVAVDVQGAASRAWVHRSSGRPTLDRAALSAVSEWRFLPARADGRSVAGIVDVPVSFRLAP